MDKASVLNDAIKYVKTLQEKVNTLETQATDKTVQAAVIVKRSQSTPDECNSSTCNNNSLDDELSTKSGQRPEIEVDEEVSLTVEGLVKRLNFALRPF
ncbi:Transcription factor bHLH25 [Carex littledalei]|uniref:Transcription factor bHLH25 n=1 Tax=Carex littledalei TaxID=544730 RepID=A0A833QWX6_9POAL|nr:Transcription factor bHLH25 [Carex littledalei]